MVPWTSMPLVFEVESDDVHAKKNFDECHFNIVDMSVKLDIRMNMK